jgi:hypothetical protein
VKDAEDFDESAIMLTGPNASHSSNAKVRKAVAVLAWGALLWHALLTGVVWYPAALVLVTVSSLVAAAIYFLPKRPTIERHSGLILVVGSLLIGVLGFWAMRMADHVRYGASHFFCSVVVAGLFLVGGVAVFLRARLAS